MPDDRAKYDQAIDEQAPAMGPSGDDFQKACDCHVPCCKQIKSMMREKEPALGPGPRMCPEMGQNLPQAPDGNNRVKCMMDEKEPAPGPLTEMCGEDGPKGDHPEGHKHIKSMMGGAIKPHADAKTIIVNVNL